MDLINRETEPDSLHFIMTHARPPEISEPTCELLKQNFICPNPNVAEYDPIMGYSVETG